MELVVCKGGEIRKKMLIFVPSTLITMSMFLGCLMVMEVSLLNNHISLGKEVSLFVKEKFIAELKKLPSFQSKDYTNALKDVFVKMDELLKSP